MPLKLINIALFVEPLKTTLMSSSFVTCLNRSGTLLMFLTSLILLILLRMAFNTFYLTCFLPIQLNTQSQKLCSFFGIFEKREMINAFKGKLGLLCRFFMQLQLTIKPTLLLGETTLHQHHMKPLCCLLLRCFKAQMLY
jgi:hypothetical protein